MIKCVHAICAERLIKDDRTNMVSVINILDQINAHGFPAIRSSLSFLFRLTREKKDKQKLNCQIKLFLNRKEINKFGIPIDFEGKYKYNLLVNVNGITWTAPGEFRYSLYHDKKLLKSGYLTIKKVTSIDKI